MERSLIVVSWLRPGNLQSEESPLFIYFYYLASSFLYVLVDVHLAM